MQFVSLQLQLRVVLRIRLINVSLQKGFGEEVPGLQRKLEQFFSEYGKVAAVRMRRIDGVKAFKVRFPSVRAVSSCL